MEEKKKFECCEAYEVCEKSEDYANGERSDFLSFEIIESLGVLSTSPSGWSKEVNVVAWNGGRPKYDIRDWAPEHDKMTRGIRLTSYEAKKLRDLLMAAELDKALGSREEE